MGYADAQARYVHTEDVTVPSAARTATGQSAAVAVGGGHTVRAFLDITAASGTSPTLDLTLQTSHNGTSSWATVASFSQKTAVSTDRKAFGPLNAFVRWQWTIGGTTPSFTFSCAADLV